MLRMLFVVPLLILAIYVGCWGQYYSESDTLSIIPADGVAGDTISITFSLVNTFNVGGFQIRMTFDNSTFGPIAMHLASRSSHYNLFGADFNTPGVAILYATSWNPLSTPIVPGSGAIASLDFVILNDAQPGSFNFNFEDSDSLSHQNSLSNCVGDSLVIPILISSQVEIYPSSGINERSPIPRNSELSQNYPNPFNGTTRISFTLEKTEMIELKVYNPLGQMVATLYSGSAPSGKTTVYWNGQAAGRDISSGLYFYRIYGSQSGAITKTMTLLK